MLLTISTVMPMSILKYSFINLKIILKETAIRQDIRHKGFKGGIIRHVAASELDRQAAYKLIVRWCAVCGCEETQAKGDCAHPFRSGDSIYL